MSMITTQKSITMLGDAMLELLVFSDVGGPGSLDREYEFEWVWRTAEVGFGNGHQTVERQGVQSAQVEP